MKLPTFPTRLASNGAIPRGTPLGSLLIGLLVAILLLTGMVHLVGLTIQDFSLIELSWPHLLFAFLLYIPSIFLRTLRMRSIAPREDIENAGLSQLAVILTMQQATAQWLPLRLGELTYAFLMKRHYAGTWSSRIGTIVIMRLADLAALGLLLCIAGLLIASAYPGVWMVATAGLVVAVFGYCGITFGSRFLLAVVHLIPARLRSRWESQYTSAFHALDVTRKSQSVLSLTVVSVTLWINTMLILWVLGKGFGLFLSFPAMALAASGGIAASLLPFSPPANLGTSEAGWVATLVLVHIPPSDALVYAIGMHVGILAITGFFGMAAFLYYMVGRRLQN